MKTKILQSMRESSASAQLGMTIVAANLLIVLFAPLIAPYGEMDSVGGVWEPGIWSEMTPNISPPAILGTDHLGRDLFSRLVFGARNTILLALIITAISFTVGSLLGFLAAIRRGWVDQVLSRCIDVLMAFPTLILALIILSVMGTSTLVLICVIALIDATQIFRVSRALARDIVVMEYFEAAKLRGERIWWLATHEVLPNALPPLVAEFGLRFCFVFLFISALSFLGLGIQPPTPDWGSMVRENAAAISFGILTPLFPAFAIATLTVGVNLVVDWFLHNASGLKDD